MHNKPKMATPHSALVEFSFWWLGGGNEKRSGVVRDGAAISQTFCSRNPLAMELLIDGLTTEQFEALPNEDMDALVFCGRPVAFRIGSAEILGQFARHEASLEIELAHIDGGGEGALPLIWKLASDHASKRGYSRIDRYVHAVNCARPNPKLRRVLLRKGFTITQQQGADVFHFEQSIAEQGGDGDAFQQPC